MAKPRTLKGQGRGYSRRQVNVRETRQRFLIVCEGTKTEPNYFKKFRVPGKIYVAVEGLGLSPIQLVEEAQRLCQEDDYDQVWCVFDRDSWPMDNFNGALSKARDKKMMIAYSNEAFELWYLLHFNYHDTRIPRSEYAAKLSICFGKAYIKNSETTYGDLENRIDNAIRNAERLLDQYDVSNPATDNPSTTVHLLVQQLRRFVS